MPVGSALCLLGFAALYLRRWLRFKAAAPVTCPQAAHGIVELAEQEARSVVDAYGNQQAYPGHTMAVLYGGGEEHSTALPSVTMLLPMQPTALLAYLEGTGYVYDKADRVFRKDGVHQHKPLLPGPPREAYGTDAAYEAVRADAPSWVAPTYTNPQRSAWQQPPLQPFSEEIPDR